MITDTQLNPIFSEILKGPTEVSMMLLVVAKVRIVTGSGTFHKAGYTPAN